MIKLSNTDLYYSDYSDRKENLDEIVQNTLTDKKQGQPIIYLSETSIIQQSY